MAFESEWNRLEVETSWRVAAKKAANVSPFRFQKNNLKVALRHFVLLFEKREGPSFRLYLRLTRKVGNAVHRNRIKRVLREFFHQKSRLLPWNTVICRPLPGTAKVKNAEIFQELDQILPILCLSIFGAKLSLLSFLLSLCPRIAG